jgi:hypothetical protein
MSQMITLWQEPIAAVLDCIRGSASVDLIPSEL